MKVLIVRLGLTFGSKRNKLGASGPPNEAQQAAVTGTGTGTASVLVQ